MSITIDFDNIIQITNDKTLSISAIKYGEVPSIKNVGTANDIKLELTIPPSEKELEIEVGKVETGDIPSVKKRLENGKLYLDFVLPTKGDQGIAGPQGTAATVEVGHVSIGNIAKVENVGTKNKAVLNFTLPYASGQGSYIPNTQGGGNIAGGGSFGGDEKTAEELKNVTAGINRSAKATEELETTIANILSQITAMVEQNKVIISRVVSQSEQLANTLGDRIDANKMAIKAIQMSTIDKAMLDETKNRMASCEQTVSLLRGELRQVFTSEAYREDKKEIHDKLDELQQSIDAINSVLVQIDNINDTINQLSSDSTQNRADIELIQASLSELSAAIASKQDAGLLVTMKDLDAGLKNSIESINNIRVTANQNTKKISDVSNDVNNLASSVQAVSQTVADVQANYAAGDKTNKNLIDALSTKVDGQNKAINETIAEIQEAQTAAENKYAQADKVYSKTDVDDALKAFVSKSGDTITGNLKVNGSVTAESFSGRLAGNADSATAAEKATNDGDGNNIVETYVTKTEFNSISGKLEDAGEKAEQAVSQIASYTGKITENTSEIEALKSAHDNTVARLDALSKEKANNADISALRSIIDTDRKSNDTKHKAFEDELAKFMLKGEIIPEAQLDSNITKKLGGINDNANAIAQLKTAQESADTKIGKNTESITKLGIDLSELNENVEQLKPSMFVPTRVSLEAIDAMFADYMSAPDNEQQGGND